MEGKHIFELLRDFRSISNKILVDHGKFKAWIYSRLKDAKANKEEPASVRRAFKSRIINTDTSDNSKKIS